MSDKTIKSQILIYKSEDGRIKLDVRFDGETVWLTQPMIAELFQTTIPNISMHLRNIFEEGELTQDATVKNFLTVRQEGAREVQRQLDFYNLDAIISVGYRVKSNVATQFRIWATKQLREFIVKGFVLDDERLKNPDLPFDYFEELLRRIQDIRTSERRFYQKITDIYATSIDYDPSANISITFFKTVQNKMHWAITGHTAAELIHSRADSRKPNMGLTNWRGPKVRKEDIAIAKNYLSEEELAALNNLVEQYLVFATGQAMRRIPMRMADWAAKLDAFLSINDREILTHAGTISHELALAFAEQQYDVFHRKQLSDKACHPDDFEKAVQKLPAPKSRGKESASKSALSRHQVKILRMCLIDMGIKELMEYPKRTDRTKFRNQVLNPLLKDGLLEMTIPDKPQSSKQKYRLTDKGRKLLEEMGSKE